VSVKERPILFQPEMVRAILDGKKTQTRRVCKPQPDDSNCIDSLLHPPPNQEVFFKGGGVSKCPYGHPGDKLYVREKFRWLLDRWSNIIEYAAGPPHKSAKGICFEKMMEAAKRRGCFIQYRPEPYLKNNESWVPSIHMHRCTSRINLQVLCVWVERVQDIHIGDCRAEGINESAHGLKPSFKALWNTINEKRGFGWNKNPLVWVVEFKLLKESKS